MILCNSWKIDSHHSVWGKRESDLDTHLKKKLHLLLLYYTKGMVEQRLFISLYYFLMATSAMFSKSLAHQLLIIKKVKNISETEPFLLKELNHKP